MAPATFCKKLGPKSDTFSKNDPVYCPVVTLCTTSTYRIVNSCHKYAIFLLLLQHIVRRRTTTPTSPQNPPYLKYAWQHIHLHRQTIRKCAVKKRNRLSSPNFQISLPLLASSVMQDNFVCFNAFLTYFFATIELLNLNVLQRLKVATNRRCLPQKFSWKRCATKQSIFCRTENWEIYSQHGHFC